MNKANEILDAVVKELQSIAAFKGNVLHIMTEKDFLESIAHASPPIAGVMYEGMRSRGEGDKPSHRIGLTADLTMSVVLVMQSKSPVGGDLRGTAIEYLDEIRNKLKDTKSIAGHSWRFVLEAPAMEKANYTFWIQRWTTPVQLTP